MTEFVSYLVVGIVTGSVYAVAATGLVVTYTTSGIFNIAHGGIGMLMAFTYWELRVNRGWPAPLALILVVLILAPLLGAGIERILIRGLRGASVATSLVVTVGLMVFLIGTANSIWSPQVGRRLPGFFGPGGIRVAGFTVTWHNLVTILVGLGVAGFLYLLLNRTRVGIAMRAVVDDRNLLAMNGARPDRVSQLSWAIGAALASLAGILLAPVLSMSVINLTLLVVNAYAAAMVGRLRSLPLTFIGALVLGLVESLVTGYITLQGGLLGLRPAMPTLFLFIALLAVPEMRLRAARLAGAVGPRVPTAKSSLLGAGALVGFVMVVSPFLSEGDITRTYGLALAYGLIMLSLVPLVGLGGQVSLCQMSFAGLGAFAMAKLGADGNILGIVAAGLLAAAVGALVALPSLRLQGLYLALSTMAFAALMQFLIFPQTWVFGNLASLEIDRLQLPGASFRGDRAYFVLLAIAFAAFGFVVHSIRRGKFGRLLAAMRDSQVACATLGLSLARTKLTVFMISAGMAGIAGALFGGLAGAAGSVDFYMIQSLPILLMAVVGGITTVSGALIGGFLYALLLRVQSWAAEQPDIGQVAAGIVFMIVGAAAVGLGRNPNGIAFFLQQLFGKVTRKLVRRRPAPPVVAEPMLSPEEVTGVAASAG